MKEIAIRLAINELKTCSFEQTRQYLKNHELAYEGGEPVIIYVDERPEHAKYIVYFQLKSVEYFLAIPVMQPERDLELYPAFLQAKIIVFFRVTSDTLSPKDISKRLELSPTRAKNKGAPVVLGHKKLLDSHLWVFETEPEIPSDLYRKLDKLLAILEPKQERVLELASVAETTIWIDYVGNSDYLGGFSFSTEFIQRVATLPL